MNKFEKVDAVLEDFLAALVAMSVKDAGDCELNRRYFTAEKGSKYIKIVSRSCAHDGGYVYCFLDANGSIYKAASWRAPAKHIRGSIFDPNFSIGKALSPYGAAYMR